MHDGQCFLPRQRDADLAVDVCGQIGPAFVFTQRSTAGKHVTSVVKKPMPDAVRKSSIHQDGPRCRQDVLIFFVFGIGPPIRLHAIADVVMQVP